MMSITEARSYVGKRCTITWIDRSGQEYKNTGLIQETKFVPMYGAYLITDADEVRLDKVTGIQTME